MALSGPCPVLPPLADAASVATDPDVIDAVQAVESMLKEKAAALPSGLVATIVMDQRTVWIHPSLALCPKARQN